MGSRSKLHGDKFIGVEGRLGRFRVEKVLLAFEAQALPAVLGRRDLRVLLGFERIDQRDLGLIVDQGPTTRTAVRRLSCGESALVAEAEPFDLAGLFRAAVAWPAPAAALEKRANTFELVPVCVYHVAGCKFEKRDPRGPSQCWCVADAGVQ